MLNKAKLFITVLFMDLLAGMEFDLCVPSFPMLKSQFALSPPLVEALLSINFIGFCLSLFFVGGLADRYGRKPILLLGLITFIVGSLLCLWPSTYLFILIGRFLQGIGIAAPTILSFLIIADAYPLKQQQFFMSILNGSMNISTAIAPVIGSYTTLFFSWKGNFAVLLFLGMAAGLMTVFFVPSYSVSQVKKTFLLFEYCRLLRSRPLLLLMTHIIFVFVPYWIFAGISPLLYMNALSVTLSQFGYYQGSLALVFGLGSFCFGFAVHRFDEKKMLGVAGYLLAFSFVCILMIILFHVHRPLWITLAFIPFIIAQIIPSNLLYPLCLNIFPDAKGRTAAIIQGGRLLLSAIGLQIAGHYYQDSFQNIGILILGCILIATITLFFIIRHRFVS